MMNEAINCGRGESIVLVYGKKGSIKIYCVSSLKYDCIDNLWKIVYIVVNFQRKLTTW